MQISTPTPPARTAPQTSSAGLPPADTAGGFASLLQQQQPCDSRAPEVAENEPADKPTTNREGRARTPSRPATRSAERPAAHAAETKTEKTAEGDAASARDAAPAGDTSARGLLDWLAALHMPPPATPAGETGDSTTVPADAAAAALGPSNGATVQRLPMAPMDETAATQAAGAGRGAREKNPLGAARLAAAPDVAAAEAASAKSAPETAEGARFSLDPAMPQRSSLPEPMAPTAATPHNPATAAASGPAAPVAVPLATPLDDPQFPRAFGVQVSVLARDGVQQAELHLNPAEMGPVSIQIVMEGTQARIDFGADAAGTRQLIEHSLPELASALREAGLTLTGGGVSQHSSGRGDAPDGSASGRHGDGAGFAAEAAQNASQPVRRTVRAGGVDLYA